MDKNVQKIMDIKIAKTAKSLIDHYFDVYIAETGVDAVQIVKNLIPQGASVNLGGSQTLFELGLIDELRTMDIELQDRYAENANIQKVFRDAFSADIYLTSSNAVTEDGILYNIDNNGNRVAAMIFGPKEVIVIAGMNKIVKNIDAAIYRLREIAAPMNNERLNRQTPCRKTGSCIDCNNSDTLCSSYVAIRRSAQPKRIKVILVKEILGY